MSLLARARAAELLALLGDRTRLLMLAEVARHDATGATIGEIATAVGEPMRKAGDACARLVALGVMTRVDGRFVARLDGLRNAAADLDDAHPITPLLDDYPKLKGIFSHGRIVSMPVLSVHGADLATLMARLCALEGPVDEPEINRRLAAVSDDVALLRRLMVDEGVVIRDRAGTTYSPAG
jgi:DNA-binding transcriptional ArsR family regulator